MWLLVGCVHRPPPTVVVPDRERYRALIEAYTAAPPPRAPPSPGPFDWAWAHTRVEQARASGRWLDAVADLRSAVVLGSEPAAWGLVALSEVDPLAVLEGAAFLERLEPGCDGGLALLRAQSLAALGRYAEAQAALAPACFGPDEDVGYHRARLWDPRDPAGALSVWSPASGSLSLAAEALRWRLAPDAVSDAEVEASLARWPRDYPLAAAAVQRDLHLGRVEDAVARCAQLPGLSPAARQRQVARVLHAAGRRADAWAALSPPDAEGWALAYELELVPWWRVPPEGRSAAAWHTRGDRGAGMPAWERAWALDPTRRDTAMALARAWVARGDPARAEERLRPALDAHPGDAGCWLALGEVALAGGHPARALDAWEEARRRGGVPDPQAWEAARVAAGWWAAPPDDAPR